MPLYMYQAAYTHESWAAQMKSPQNRVEAVGHQVCEAAGGKFVGGWLCFGEYDLTRISWARSWFFHFLIGSWKSLVTILLTRHSAQVRSRLRLLMIPMTLR